MAVDLDREGNFQIAITEYAVKAYDSGAKAIAVTANVLSQWNAETGQWDDWSGYEPHVVHGYLIVIKKDGKPNNGQVEALCKHAGWNASLSDVADGKWMPTPCQCSVEANTYNDTTTYRIGFINAFDRVPGGMGGLSVDEAKALDMQYGAALRAVAGSATHGTTKPAGKPPAPSRKNVEQHPYPDTNALDDVNAALQQEGAKARRGGEVDEPDFVKN